MQAPSPSLQACGETPGAWYVIKIDPPTLHEVIWMWMSMHWRTIGADLERVAPRVANHLSSTRWNPNEPFVPAVSQSELSTAMNHIHELHPSLITPLQLATTWQRWTLIGLNADTLSTWTTSDGHPLLSATVNDPCPLIAAIVIRYFQPNELRAFKDVPRAEATRQLLAHPWTVISHAGRAPHSNSDPPTTTQSSRSAGSHSPAAAVGVSPTTPVPLPQTILYLGYSTWERPPTTSVRLASSDVSTRPSQSPVIQVPTIPDNPSGMALPPSRPPIPWTPIAVTGDSSLMSWDRRPSRRLIFGWMFLLVILIGVRWTILIDSEINPVKPSTPEPTLNDRTNDPMTASNTDGTTNPTEEGILDMSYRLGPHANMFDQFDLVCCTVPRMTIPSRQTSWSTRPLRLTTTRSNQMNATFNDSSISNSIRMTSDSFPLHRISSLPPGQLPTLFQRFLEWWLRWWFREDNESLPWITYVGFGMDHTSTSAFVLTKDHSADHGGDESNDKQSESPLPMGSE